MLVKVYTSANDCKELETSKTFLKEILNELKQTFGEELTNEILYNKYFYFLKSGDTIVGIEEELLGSELDGYKELIIVKEVEGEIPVIIMGLMAVASYAGVAYSAINASSLGSAAFKLAAAYALNNIYAPDSSFEKDPSKSQGKESKIFNNATVIREQGGAVPVVYGNPYCGGVLISSSISSEDVKK